MENGVHADNAGALCRLTTGAPGALALETWLFSHKASALPIMADIKIWQVR